MWKDNISFILIEPREPGNIGSAARAMKNMGFRNLELVNPADYRSREAGWFARNSEDVLENAKVYSSFGEAIADKTVVIGTSRRRGKIRGLLFPIEEYAPKIPELALKNKVAIVFGREDRGLTNEEIRKCSFLLTIPTDRSQPSLNLAHAVLIVGYELSNLKARSETEVFVQQEKMASLYIRVSRIVRDLGYLPRGQRDMEETIMRNIKNILGRSGLTEWEYNMLLGLCTRVEELTGRE